MLNRTCCLSDTAASILGPLLTAVRDVCAANSPWSAAEYRTCPTGERSFCIFPPSPSRFACHLPQSGRLGVTFRWVLLSPPTLEEAFGIFPVGSTLASHLGGGGNDACGIDGEGHSAFFYRAKRGTLSKRSPCSCQPASRIIDHLNRLFAVFPPRW